MAINTGWLYVSVGQAFNGDVAWECINPPGLTFVGGGEWLAPYSGLISNG